MKRLRILTLLLIPVAYALYSYKPSIIEPATIEYSDVIPDEWYKTEGKILTPEADRRLADQTFLTFPEWFLVYSPEEQAEFFRKEPSTNYSYQSQVNQFWDSYNILNKHLEGKYPYNEEYNTMIGVIGVSTELEYNMKSWYEMVIGRATQTASLTDEDLFTQKYTSEYANFLNTAAWYDFDYNEQLKDLWTETSFFGWNMHRKLERKYLLTSEFLIKIAYAELIKYGSQSMYGEIPTTTVVVTDSLTDLMKKNATIDVLSSSEDGHVIRIPRYTAFMYTATEIALEDVNIIEVAGNKSAILTTVIAPTNQNFDPKTCRALFAQKLANNNDFHRVAICTPIDQLCAFIRFCEKNGIEIEHIYDF
ncbi:MAG: hypothetical protein RL365_815 [Bacteroidota bacterium]|jgi:hypothetical protein